MRPARVRLIDIGMDDSFDVSMSFAQSLIKSLGAQQATPVAEIEFVRTRDSLTTMSALQAPAAIIHVMAHGETDPDSLGFWGDRSELTLTELAEQFHTGGEGIEAGVFLADCCNTAQGRFVRAIRDCIEEPITYIGASKSVDWHESTTFASAFYGSYFRDRGKGLSPMERGWSAAERAIAGYEEIVAGGCPFKVLELKPSRAARRSVAG